MYIIQRKAAGNDIETGFNVVWAFQTQEELFDFFHEDAHSQLKQGLENLYNFSMFEVESGEILYRVSRATKPFYMK